MGNSITFRLNPKHAEDRAIKEWLDANAGTEGGQTALVKSALLAVIQENNESDYYQKMLKEIQVAISKENEVFTGTVKEVMQAMVNQLFAGSLAMMGQVQKPLQVEQPQQLSSHVSVAGARCCTTEENLGTEVRNLETDNHNSMDMDTRSALGNLFDDED